MKSLVRDSHGDTIVEVLISIIVISSLLVGAFAATRYNTAAVQASSERSTGLKVAESQIELIRAHAKNSPNDIFDSGSPFCIDQNSSVNIRKDFSSMPSIPSDPTKDDFSKYPPECQNVNTRYNVSIVYDDITSLFTIRARWDSPNAKKEEVKIKYRMYKGVSLDTSDDGKGGASIGFIEGGGGGGGGIDGNKKPHWYIDIVIKKADPKPGHKITHCEVVWPNGDIQKISASKCKVGYLVGNRNFAPATPPPAIKHGMECSTYASVFKLYDTSNSSKPSYTDTKIDIRPTRNNVWCNGSTPYPPYEP